MDELAKIASNLESQSLWNRAVSSDVWKRGKPLELTCLNPFGTGQCLPTMSTNYIEEKEGLNPFGTGQCLPTKKSLEKR